MILHELIFYLLTYWSYFAIKQQMLRKCEKQCNVSAGVIDYQPNSQKADIVLQRKKCQLSVV